MKIYNQLVVQRTTLASLRDDSNELRNLKPAFDITRGTSTTMNRWRERIFVNWRWFNAAARRWRFCIATSPLFVELYYLLVYQPNFYKWDRFDLFITASNLNNFYSNTFRITFRLMRWSLFSGDRINLIEVDETKEENGVIYLTNIIQ